MTSSNNLLCLILVAGAKEKKHSRIGEIVARLKDQVKCRLQHKSRNAEVVELKMTQLIVSRGQPKTKGFLFSLEQYRSRRSRIL